MLIYRAYYMSEDGPYNEDFAAFDYERLEDDEEAWMWAVRKAQDKKKAKSGRLVCLEQISE